MSLVIRQTNENDFVLCQSIYKFLFKEMQRGNIVFKSFVEIESDILAGRAFVALLDNIPIGYVSIKIWETCLELMTFVVDAKYRKHGVGTKLVELLFSHFKDNEKQLYVLVNENSGPIVRKLGFQSVYKLSMPEELIKPCVSCKEFSIFPNCHCQAMVLPKLNQVLIQELKFDDIDRVKQVAELYCNVWQEPPWNEFFWQVAEVAKYIKNFADSEFGIWLVAMQNKEVVGFTAGKIVDREQMKVIAEQQDISNLNVGGTIGYIAEVAIRNDMRNQGVASELVSLLMDVLQGHKVNSFTGRTKTICMEKVFQKFGYWQTKLAMKNDPQRFYWSKVL